MVIQVTFKSGSEKSFKNFEQLFLSDKHIVLGEIVTLYCSVNRIQVIPPEIRRLTNLRTFVCKSNQIRVIPPEIQFLTNLQAFDCRDNQITVIPPEIRFLTNLQVFYCSYNKIKVILPEIQFLTNLRWFDCKYNQIQVIPPEIRGLTNLQEFDCSCNQITQIPFEITYCGRLKCFGYSNNEIDVLNPAVERFVNGLRNIRHHTIYTDSQSVHNSVIQSSIKESIITILNEWTEKVCEENILDHLLKNESITTQSQILEYFLDNTVHSVVNVTFKELFLIIYNRLVRDNQTEVFKILNQEMKDSECKCFTGRLNRLVSSLSGFYSEVKVSISKSDEISNVISVMKTKFSDTITLKQKVSGELLSRGYLEADFKEWLEYIE